MQRFLCVLLNWNQESGFKTRLPAHEHCSSQLPYTSVYGIASSRFQWKRFTTENTNRFGKFRLESIELSKSLQIIRLWSSIWRLQWAVSIGHFPLSVKSLTFDAALNQLSVLLVSNWAQKSFVKSLKTIKTKTSNLFTELTELSRLV